MALVLKDRVKETTTTVGLGTISLGGSSDTFEPFSTIGTGNTTYYAIVAEGNDNWEVGVGTVGSGTLSRDIVLASSNLNAKVNFPAGVKDVFVTLPANKIVSKDDATGINSGISLADYVDFDTVAAPATAVGRLFWNDQDGTLDVGLKGGSVTLHIGQKQVIRIVNKIGSSLSAANYQCVKISGAQGQRPKVALAQANNDANSADTIGLVNETIANNQEGFVCTGGTITNINTTGSLQGESWNDGDVLYLSGTVAGRITNVRPQAPIHTVIVGFVIYAHANQGKIFVKVDNGYELDELHNVRINGVTNGQVLTYNNGLWENQTNGSGTVTSVSGTGGYGGLTLTGTVTSSGNLTLGGTPTGTWPVSVSGNAATVTNGVYTTGDQTIGGNKNFSSTIIGSVSGNAGTVTNGVYITGDQTIGGAKTFSTAPNAPTLAVGTNNTSVATTEFVNAEIANDAPSKTGTGASGTWGISVTGNAGTVTNGVYTTGNQTIVGTKTFSSDVILSGGTANGVLYLTGSKYVTSGGTLVFNGSQLGINVSSPSYSLDVAGTFNIASNGSSNTATINHTSGSGIALNISKGGNNEAIYVNKTSGSGNAVTVVGTVQATSFVGALTGNAGTVTNGVYTTGDQTIAGIKTFSGASTIVGGNLGVGTASPSAPLDVVSDGSAIGLRVRGRASDNFGLIQFGSNNAVSDYAYIGSPSANQIAIYTNGFTERMRIDSAGNVGIGTSSPSTKLDVNGAIRAQGATISASGEGLELIYTGSTPWHTGNQGLVQSYNRGSSTFSPVGFNGSFLSFATASTERMRIDSSGNVGIGTGSPNAKLHLYGVTGAVANSYIENGDVIVGGKIGGQYFYSRGTSNNWFSGIDSYVPSGSGGVDVTDLRFYTTNVTVGERMRINGAGNLGLGVTPSAWWGGMKSIDVGGVSSLAGGSNFLNLVSNGYLNSSLSYIYKTSSFATLYQQASSGQHQWFNAPSGTAGNAISFTQAMTLDASGNLGIGTSSPASKLDVNGSANINGGLTIAGNLLAPSGATIYTATGDLYVRSGSSGALRFGSNGSNDRMLLDSAGNLGLGVTPSAWGNGVSAQGDGWSISTTSGFDSLAITANARQTAYGNGGQNWVYRGTAGASSYEQTNGNHIWRYASSGTAGNAVTFTQAMTLTNSGNLLVGGTANSFSARIYSLETSATEKNNLALYTTGAHNTARMALYNDAGAASVQSISGSLSFSSGGVGSGNERMRITSAGNVGIGTSAPQVRLDLGNMTGEKLRLFSSAYIGFGVDMGGIYGNSSYTNSAFNWGVWNGTTWTERMRIDSAGKVLIGGGSPTASLGDLVVSKPSSGTAVIALESQGSWNSQISSTSTGNMIFSNGTNERMRINASGDVGIGTSSPSQKLEVGGSILASGNVTAYSDIRVKDNVESIEGAIGKLNQIRGVTYTRTDLDDKQRRFAGVIAQEIEQVLPEAVFDNGKVKAVDYNATIALLIEAVKEQQGQINELKLTIEQLKGN